MIVLRNLKVISLMLLMSASCYGQSAIQAQTEFDYPELMVTPLASVKVKMEAAQETTRNRWSFHAPYTLSAASTLLAGIVQFTSVDDSKDQDGYSPIAGVGVGAGLLAINYLLNSYYKPYTIIVKQTANLSTKSKKDLLTIERESEAAINDAGALADKLMWLSVISNAGASLYMISMAESKSLGQGFGSASLLLAFTPLIFSSPWQRTRTLHGEYKKKIYAPIAFNGLIMDNVSKKIVPGLSLAFSF